jgi:hypothetical protein
LTARERRRRWQPRNFGAQTGNQLQISPLHIAMPSSRPRIAYTDADRYDGICTETAILDEYKRLKLPAVRGGDVLLSPALARLLAEAERREDAVAPQTRP